MGDTYLPQQAWSGKPALPLILRACLFFTALHLLSVHHLFFLYLEFLFPIPIHLDHYIHSTHNSPSLPFDASRPHRWCTHHTILHSYLSSSLFRYLLPSADAFSVVFSCCLNFLFLCLISLMGIFLYSSIFSTIFLFFTVHLFVTLSTRALPSCSPLHFHLFRACRCVAIFMGENSAIHFSWHDDILRRLPRNPRRK